MQPQHPLDMLTGEEIERAVALVRSTGRLVRAHPLRPRRARRTRQGRARAVEGGRSRGTRRAGARGARAHARPGRGGRVADRPTSGQRRGARVARGRGNATCAPDDRSNERDVHDQGASRVRRRAGASAASRISTRSRSTRGRPVRSGTTPSRTGASRAASPSCAPMPPTTATPGRSRVSWSTSTSAPTK